MADAMEGEKANGIGSGVTTGESSNRENDRRAKRGKKSRKKLLRALTRYLQGAINDWQELKKFKDTVEDSESIQDGDNALHIMEKSGSEGEAKRRFLKWMLQQQEHQDELVEQDKLGYTPMHNALINQNIDFVNDVLDVKGINIINILMYKSSMGNCLHLATQHSFPNLSKMVEKCAGNTDVFMEGENTPNGTPLHIAVNVDRPSDEEDEEEDDDDYEDEKGGSVPGGWAGRHASFSDQKNNLGGNSGESKQKLDSERGSGTSKELNKDMYSGQYQGGQRERLYWIFANLDKQIDRPRPPPKTPTECTGTEGIGNGRPEGDASPASQHIQMKDPVELPAGHSVRLLVEACPGALTTKNAADRTPYQEREHFLLNDKLVLEFVRRYAEGGGHDGDTKENREARAKRVVITKDPVAHYIRSFCMHNSISRDETMKRLYKPGQEFDLEGMPTPIIKHEYLDQLEKHLKFESILKYVALPALSIESRPTGGSRSSAALPSDTRSETGRNGRSDLITVFNWLWRGGVREIIKVMVVDDGEIPHADASIVEALYGFKVEEWDWKRVDLCSDVIHESSPAIREVSLYSSGNNAVLMGWASEEGLVNREKFPYLETVKLYIQDGYEDEVRWSENITRWEKKIEEGKPGPGGGKIKVKIIRDNNPVKFFSELSAPDHIEEVPPWIKSIQDFSTFLMNAARDKGNVSPVKIAIIDDGIDATMHDLQPKIAGGATFCPYPHSPVLVNSYYVPRGNHGTLMAQLICSICPSPQLYIARLEELPALTGSGRSVTARSAAKAVDWAINCGVDIISMSWTIQTAVQDNADMDQLKRAINRAHDAEILMFCSASDQGANNKEVHYPGGWGRCIRIGGATFTGEKLTWVNDEVDFWFPGRNVPFLARDGKSTVYESGSSVATAAASGLAGVLIYSDRLRCDNAISGQRNPFKSQDAIKTAFKIMAKGEDGRFPRTYDFLIKHFRTKIQQSEPKLAKNPNIEISDLEWTKATKKALNALLLRLQDK
ncbi:putative subtilisin [Hypomontagnella submonticulosa]|nr:putative subtilisin [Hypomontagnella submonticulosa]